MEKIMLSQESILPAQCVALLFYWGYNRKFSNNTRPFTYEEARLCIKEPIYLIIIKHRKGFSLWLFQ